MRDWGFLLEISKDKRMKLRPRESGSMRHEDKVGRSPESLACYSARCFGLEFSSERVVIKENDYLCQVPGAHFVEDMGSQGLHVPSSVPGA